MKHKLFVIPVFVFFVSISILNLRAQTPPAIRAATAEGKPNVAILVFDGVQIIDYTGPYEVMNQWGLHKVFTVAEKADPITTNGGMRVVPNYTFENQPHADTIIIPGGGGVSAALKRPAVIKWIQDNARDAKHVLTVCNGAFLAAKAGILDGLTATTTAGFIPRLAKEYPNIKVVSDKRYVDNGKVITTAGLSSGIDGALHLLSEEMGKGTAQMVALSMEYNWQPDTTYARASLADTRLPYAIYEPFLSNGKPELMEGDQKTWHERWQVKTSMPAVDMLKAIEAKWISEKGWSGGRNNTSGQSASAWNLVDSDGKLWNATVDVQPAGGSENQLIVSLMLNRSESRSAHK